MWRFARVAQRRPRPTPPPSILSFGGKRYHRELGTEAQAQPAGPPTAPDLADCRILFSPVVPASIGRWDPRRLLALGMDTRLKGWLPPDMTAVSIVSTPREGAAIARCQYDKRRYPSVESLLQAIQSNLTKTRSDQVLHKLSRMPNTKAFAVLGDPFLEDVMSNWTSRTLKVTIFLERVASGTVGGTKCASIEFERSGLAYPLTLEEELFSTFRPYGKIDNMVIHGDAVAQAGNVGTATIDFHTAYSAMAAILCVRGCKLPGGRVIHADYIPFLATRTLSKFMKDHTRIALALLALLVALLSIAVLDPMRKFSIKMRILSPSGTLSLTGKSGPTWLRSIQNTLSSTSLWAQVSSAWQLVVPSPSTSPSRPVDSNLLLGEAPVPPTAGSRQGDELALEQWLKMEAKAPLILSGHTGTGKMTLISHVLQSVGIQNVVHVDVHQMLEKKDDMMIHDMASSFGFVPGFRGVQILSKLMDVVTPGASVSVSVGGSDHNQVVQILDLTRSALSDIRTRRLAKEKNGEHSHVPLFVFTGFKEDNLAKHEKLLPMLMLWASEVSKEGLAQVLVVTNYSMLSDNVSRYLPNRVESLELHDVNFDVAVEYVHRRMLEEGGHIDATALEAIALLGGRFHDLDQFIRMFRAGVPALEAAERIISKAELHLRNVLFRPSILSDKARQWRPDQMWNVMLSVAASSTKEVSYDATLLAVFKGDEVALQQLISLDLLSVTFKDAVPHTLRAGSAVYHEAFMRLTQDKEVRPGMEILCTQQWLAKERETIDALETELSRLQDVIGSQPGWSWFWWPSSSDDPLISRQQFLLRELKVSQAKCAKWEARKAAAMAALTTKVPK